MRSPTAAPTSATALISVTLKGDWKPLPVSGGMTNGAVPGDVPSDAACEDEAPCPSRVGTQQTQCAAGGCGQHRSCSAPRARRAVSAAVALQLIAEAEPPVGRAAKHDDHRCTCGAPSAPAARCIARSARRARKAEAGAVCAIERKRHAQASGASESLHARHAWGVCDASQALTVLPRRARGALRLRRRRVSPPLLCAPLRRAPAPPCQPRRRRRCSSARTAGSATLSGRGAQRGGARCARDPALDSAAGRDTALLPGGTHPPRAHRVVRLLQLRRQHLRRLQRERADVRCSSVALAR